MPESLLPERSGPAEPCEPERRIKGTFIYGGYLFKHFGHFLTESLSRLYAIKRCPNLPVLFIDAERMSRNDIEKWLRYLRAPNEVHVIRKPVEVEEIIVPPPGCFETPPFISPGQIEALGVFDPDRQGMTDEKVWLSRSRVEKGGLSNEKDIEDVLGQWGWRIVHPQFLPIPVQTHLVSTSRYVAGLDGSAFYAALLSQKILGKYFVFSRRLGIPKLLSLVLARKRIDAEEHIPRSLEHVSGTQASSAVSRLKDTEEILGVLRGL